MITAKPISQAHENRGIEMRMSQRIYAVMRTGVFAMLTLAAVLVLVMQMRLSAINDPSPAPLQPLNKFSSAKTGPWGQLQFLRINIERPDEFIPLTPEILPPVQWFFDGVSIAQVGTLFKQKGISEGLSAKLLNSERCQQTPQGVVMRPGDRTIVELTATERAAIYHLLSLSSRNSAHWMPTAFTQSGLDEIYKQNNLQPETYALFKHLLYQRGESVCFSDLDTTLRLIRSDKERHRLIKMISRQTTLLVKIRVTSKSDIDELLTYWGGEGRTKDLRPLLESLATSSTGTTIDVAHLLPALARKLLYTYPFPSANAPPQNCFWTAFNFFNRKPIDALAHPEEVEKVLRTEYQQVVGAPGFGDVVVISSPELGLMHAAVYVADDIVFTKNGGSYTMPWVLMKIDELLAAYPMPGNPSVSVVRRKSSSPVPSASPENPRVTSAQ